MNKNDFVVMRENEETNYEKFIGAGINVKGQFEFVVHNLDSKEMEEFYEKIEILIRMVKKEVEEGEKKQQLSKSGQ